MPPSARRRADRQRQIVPGRDGELRPGWHGKAQFGDGVEAFPIGDRLGVIDDDGYGLAMDASAEIKRERTLWAGPGEARARKTAGLIRSTRSSAAAR